MRSLDAIGQWPGRHAALVVSRSDDSASTGSGALDEPFAYASVTKLASSLAVLVEVGRGTCTLDDRVGPPGATLAHVLSHASGLPLEGNDPVAAPGARRVYSNAGIDVAVAHAARAARTSASTLVAQNVFEPLGMRGTSLVGRPSSGAVGPTRELGMLARELLTPTLLGPELVAAQRDVRFPGLVGVLPGFGRQDPCDWALGPEVKGSKSPHWTGASWPPASFGHFGQAGGFVVVDAVAGLALATLGDAAFGPWATARWPAFTDEVRAELDA